MKDTKVDMIEQAPNNQLVVYNPAQNQGWISQQNQRILWAIQTFLWSSIASFPGELLKEINSSIQEVIGGLAFNQDALTGIWKNGMTNISQYDVILIDKMSEILAKAIAKSSSKEALGVLKRELPGDFLDSDLPQWLSNTAESLMPRDNAVAQNLFALINAAAGYTPQVILDKINVSEEQPDAAKGLWETGFFALIGGGLNFVASKAVKFLFPQAMIAQLMCKTAIKVIGSEIFKDAKAVGQRPVYFDGFGDGLEDLFNVPESYAPDAPDAAMINQISYYGVISEAEQRNQAALTIQKVFRGHQVRSQIEEQNQAALTIQSVFRGRQGRKVAAEARAIQMQPVAPLQPTAQPKHSTAFYVCSTILGAIGVTGVALLGLYYTGKMPNVLKEGLESACSKAMSLREYIPSMGVSR